MADKSKPYVIADLSGGRNGFDPPWAIKDNECVDNPNIDYYRTRFGRKRGGMATVSTTFSAGGPFTGTISSLFRHVPGVNQTAAELWAIDDAATNVVGRMAGATTFAAPTLFDNPTGNGYDWTAASINGKLNLAYKNAGARHHVWDGSTVRRSGLGTLAGFAGQIANTGAGTYAAVLRYYRGRATVQSGGVTIRRSEPSSVGSFTPSGGGTAARITLPTPPGEGETHWEIEASTDNVTFYRIATVAIGTTIYDDSAVTTTYSSNPLSALTGVYTLFPNIKFVAADQNRVLGFADWTAANKQSRLYISAIIGSSDIGDDERIDTSATNYYIDFDESDSGVPTGLVGPVLGSFFVFKDRRTWMLTATGQSNQPYRVDNISKDIGALHHYAVARGEDAFGNTALYWMSHRGPYRWSVQGLEYLGRNVEDFVLTGTMINLAATKSVARVVYYSDLRQVWYWWATGSSNDCNQGMVYDVVTGGWSRIPTGDKRSNVRCAVMFSNTLGASMSYDLKPYVGETAAANTLSKCDSGTDDHGTTFQATITTKDLEVGGPNYFGDVGDLELLAKAANGVTITATVTAQFGVPNSTSTGTAVLTAAGSEARVVKRMEGSSFNGGQASFYNVQIGDAAAVSNGWTLERLLIPLSRLQQVAQ